MTAVTRRAVNLSTLLTRTARRLPDHDAVVHGDRRWTWSDLDVGVHALARHFRAHGVRPGDCVLLHATNHVELIQTMFATWRVGAVLAPTNSRLTAGDVTVIADVCRPVLMVCDAAQPEHAAAVAETVGGLDAGVLWLGGTGADAVSTVAPLGTGGGTVADPVADAAVGLGDPAWYFFTSGTSGRPKAAVLTHDQMGFVVTNHLADLMPATGEDDASLVLAPLSHGAGVHLLPQVATGARTVLPTSAGLDAPEVWRLVEREHVTNMFTVPTILKKITEHPDAAKRDHGSLRYVIYAGAPMYTADQEHARSVLGDVLVQYYGLGEVTGTITVLPRHEHGRPRPDGVEFGTCGRVRTGMEIVLRDPDGTEVPQGGTGEICVAGPAVCHGYLHDDEADAAAFRDGWFHTGDLGVLDGHGYLYITGRASDMYISGGSNVHPRDIEEKLVAHPAISECAVLGMPHPVWGEVGVAVWVSRPRDPTDAARAGDAGTDGVVDAEVLLAWLEPKLARYKLPRHFVRWDELPKSGYGKIAKRDIREKLIADGWRDGRPGSAS